MANCAAWRWLPCTRRKETRLEREATQRLEWTVRPSWPYAVLRVGSQDDDRIIMRLTIAAAPRVR